MKYYERLVDLGCFTRDDLEKMTGNRATAHSIIEAYKKRKLIDCVRRDLFVAISMETKQPVSSRYVIASHTADGAYVSYHSAFEYHGLANQVYYEIYAASKHRFRSFEYGGIIYKHVAPSIESGVEEKSNGVRVTNIERTVLDGIDNFNKVGGFEELLRCIGMIPYLDGTLLCNYLSEYNKMFLYQKAGYILSHFRKDLKLKDNFFDTCMTKITGNKRYITESIREESNVFDKTWRLYVPKDLESITNKGGYYVE